MLLIGTAKCGQETLVIVYLTIGIGMSGIQYAGVTVNYLDIAPSFVGPIFGLGNTISCAAGILSPLVMGWLTPTVSFDLSIQSTFFIILIYRAQNPNGKRCL